MHLVYNIFRDAPLHFALSVGPKFFNRAKLYVVPSNPESPESSATNMRTCAHFRECIKQAEGYWRAALLAGYPTIDPTQADLDKLSGHKKDGVLFFAPTQDSVNALRPFWRHFSATGYSDAPMHLVAPGVQNGFGCVNALTAEASRNDPDAMVDCFDTHFEIYDLDFFSKAPFTRRSQGKSDMMEAWSFILAASRPRVIITTSNNPIEETENLKALSKDLDITFISLPPEQVQYCNWIADLPIGTIRNWHLPQVKLKVITNNRPQSLSRLLRSMELSYMLNDNVDLEIDADHGADLLTLQIMRSYFWEFGSKLIRHRVIQGKLMAAVIESWYPLSRDEYAIFLEDDIEVSPFFYIWSKYSLLRYRYGPKHDSTPQMAGISLYTPQKTKWFAAEISFQPTQ